MRTLAVVSVGRSDIGLLTPVLRRAMATQDAKVVLMLCGQHLAQGIEKYRSSDLAHHVEIVGSRLSGDTAVEIGNSIGSNVAAFTNALASTRPDIVTVLGDRHETMAAAIATLTVGLPIAHIHGGELTEGAMDEQFRHAITKLAHLHFVAAPAMGRRLEQMGEEAWRITVSGAPGLDWLPGFIPLTRDVVASTLQIDPREQWLIVTLHPETLDGEHVNNLATETLAGLDHWDGVLLFTAPNADENNQTIREEIDRFTASRPKCHFVESLGQERYLSFLHHASAMVGNSSSGLIEAPSFGLPVVNIGERQAGRLHAENVITVAPRREAVEAAVRKATSPQFRESLKNMANPYGDGRAASRILATLMSVPLDRRLRVKRFVDIEWPSSESE